ncbi:hypothetical protein DL93DRAFT_2076392 [Clavulina sp. PMI_390]|nr:hypothetical protein DL93DRAFT_2076392 [Clavulina sp. PMI_390]
MASTNDTVVFPNDPGPHWNSHPPMIPPFDTPDVRRQLDELKVVTRPAGHNIPPRKYLARVPSGEKTPRPRNPWILYRSDKLLLANVVAARAGLTGQRMKPQAGLSRDIATDWHNENHDVREYYQYNSEVEKIEHKAVYPEYKFAPRNKEDREAEREAERAVASAKREVERARKAQEKREKMAAQRRAKKEAAGGRPSRPRPVPIDEPVASTSKSGRPASPIPSSSSSIMPPQLYPSVCIGFAHDLTCMCASSSPRRFMPLQIRKLRRPPLTLHRVQSLRRIVEHEFARRRA